MRKTFKLMDICPFDLMRWNKDALYTYADQEYFKLFGVYIEILEMELSFIKGGIKCKIITHRT